MPQWNLLLVSSANGVEVGVLGTTEAGDTPTWQQLTLLDEARIELPLSEDTQDETYPLGFVFDTSSTHQLSINEQPLPIMPMMHVLGTDGNLLTFNFLNLQPGAASVCSPPPPLADTSGKFCALDALLGAEQQPPQATATATAVAPPPPPAQVEASTPVLSDISFAFTPNTVTSTPAPIKDKQPSLFAGFGNVANIAPPAFGAPSAPLSFAAAAAKPMPAPSFGAFGTANMAPPPGTSMFSLPAGNNVPSFTNQVVPNALAQQPAMTTTTAAPIAAPNKASNKPLYTVPPTFTPVAAAPAATPKQPPSVGSKSSEFSAVEMDDVIVQIMNVQISAFSELIEQQKQQNQALLSQVSLLNSS